jgi:hypothetical protein
MAKSLEWGVCKGREYLRVVFWHPTNGGSQIKMNGGKSESLIEKMVNQTCQTIASYDFRQI